jgi:trans-2,3-dihydro-3-hydroxyanthranilate isomerase
LGWDEGGFALFLYVPTLGAPQRFSARMFARLDNVLEDPATGSSATEQSQSRWC